MATTKRLLPIGIQDFSDIRTRGFVYADKTVRAYEHITGSGKAFFFRRKASPSIDSSGANLFISAKPNPRFSVSRDWIASLRSQ